MKQLKIMIKVENFKMKKIENSQNKYLKYQIHQIQRKKR
jgi:hypothetical protein